MSGRERTNRAYLEEHKQRLESNLTNSRKFLAFFESRLPAGYTDQRSTAFPTDIQNKFAESAYSHKQLIAMLEMYHAEVVKALAEYEKNRH